jgi:hypothetical protein
VEDANESPPNNEFLDSYISYLDDEFDETPIPSEDFPDAGLAELAEKNIGMIIEAEETEINQEEEENLDYLEESDIEDDPYLRHLFEEEQEDTAVSYEISEKEDDEDISLMFSEEQDISEEYLEEILD